MKNPIKDKDKKKSTYRVRRAGSWDYDARDVRVADRDWFGPSYREYNLGLRIVRSKDEKSN